MRSLQTVVVWSISHTPGYFNLFASLKANTVTSIFAVGVINGTPQIEFVTAQVAGLPGVPLTGSDPNPNAAPGESQALSPWIWLFGVLALMGIGGAVVATCRLALAHRQVIV